MRWFHAPRGACFAALDAGGGGDPAHQETVMSVAYDPKVRTTYTDDVEKLRAAHKVLLEVPFAASLPDRGYTRRTLFIDLDTLTVKEKPVTEEMIDIFTGGRGFGLYYLWHAITPQTKWNDPDSTLVISPGPIAGH